MNPLQRTRRWVGEHLILGLGLLVLLYTFVPIAVVVLMSFNDSSKSRNVYKFQEFTFQNWLHPFKPSGMGDSVLLSIEIALLATLVATILGTLGAFALVRHRFAGRSSANLIIFLPMASPEIVMGSSLLALFVSTSLIPLGFWTIFIAHVMFCLSFVIVTVKARLSGLDDNLEQAAMDLYATESQTFWRVTFPLVLPGIVGAA
ncbi:MAG: transporter permease, partial [Aeromicrobium sp.]|nr:transporter permease [Aeromicrobium sp.]